MMARIGERARRALWLAFVFWVISGALYVLLLLASKTALTAELALRLAILFASGVALSVVPYRVARWGRDRSAVALAPAMVGAVLLASLLLMLTDMVAAGILGALFRPGNVGRGFVINALGFVWLYGLLATMFVALQSGLTARERDVELGATRARVAQAEAMATAARLAALRYQLNPHFLFNTLNAVSSLVITDRTAEADAMLAKLSDFLRATLMAESDGLVPLAQEFAMLETYLEIERVRFGERLRAQLICPAELEDTRVPSFITQPLVENAVKYAVAPVRRPVTIRVAARTTPSGLAIAVDDDGDPDKAAAVAPGTGLGLVNVRDRLRALYGDTAGMTAGATLGGYQVSVTLPIVAVGAL